jgi:hypothetical protein
MGTPITSPAEEQALTEEIIRTAVKGGAQNGTNLRHP